MDSLPDELLVEILARAPPFNQVVRCRAISRHFLGVMTRDQFISRFIQIQHENSELNFDDGRYEQLWVLVRVSQDDIILVFPHSVAFTLAYLTRQLRVGVLQSPYPPATVAVSNGLILCRGNAAASTIVQIFQQPSWTFGTVGRASYQIWNPLTRRSVRLPLPPVLHSYGGVFIGFVSEPFYRLDGGQVVLNHHYRFRVVILLYLHWNRLHELVFISETGRWRTRVLSMAGDFMLERVRCRPGVVRGERMYFMGCTGVLVLEPFVDHPPNSIGFPQVINFPLGSNADNLFAMGYIGICRGNVQMCAVLPDATRTEITISVWQLDEPTSNWILRHRAVFRGRERLAVHQLWVRAFHPYHGDIVFLQHRNQLHSVNLATGQFRAAGTTRSGEILALQLPCYPTPMPFIQRQ